MNPSGVATALGRVGHLRGRQRNAPLFSVSMVFIAVDLSGLRFIQPPVGALPGHQLVVFSDLHHLVTIHHHQPKNKTAYM